MRFFANAQNNVFFKKNGFTLAEGQQADFHIVKKSGFTLAEVLITLVIIGVIAALTIHTLMQNMNEKATVTKLKKAFTTLNNATLAAVAENGSIDTWGFGAASEYGANSVKFNNNLKPYLKVIKDCGTGTGCWSETTSKSLNDPNWYNFNTATTHARMILSDGVFLDTCIDVPACTAHRTTNTELPIYNVCGWFTLDTDGYKGENTLAKDIFQFYITKQGQIVPLGTPEDTITPISKCAMNQAGTGCTAWVIYKENMDYLKGKTVAW